MRGKRSVTMPKKPQKSQKITLLSYQVWHQVSPITLKFPLEVLPV